MEKNISQKKLYTIGYTKKKARDFFEILQTNNIDMLIDIRLNNVGQLAGFTKKDDLEYLLGIFNINYEYWKEFAPTKEIRDRSRLTKSWDEYKTSYLKLIDERKVLENIDFDKLKDKNIVFLCSEPTSDTCHRRLVAEEISKRLNMEVIHL